jgi:hypothetical protein
LRYVDAISSDDLYSSRFEDVPGLRLEVKPQSERSFIPGEGCRTIEGVLGDDTGEEEGEVDVEKGRCGMVRTA